MAGGKSLTAATVLIGFAGSYVAACERYAANYGAQLNDIAVRAETAPVEDVEVTIGFGCGWSLGVQITARTTFGGDPAEFFICRNRDGSGRFDIIQTTSAQLRAS